MKDIVVTMPKSFGYDHLLEKNVALNQGGTAWWNMKRIPKELTIESKIFVIVNSEIDQYYTIASISEFSGKIYLESFRNIKIIRMKGFQGFRYRNFDYQLLKNEK